MRQPYPVVKRTPCLPSQQFSDWVAQFKPTRLARSLGVNRSAVHSWITPHGKRRKPRTETVLDIVALSEVEPLRGKIKLTRSCFYSGAVSLALLLRGGFRLFYPES